MDLSAAGIDDCSLWRGWYTKCDECSLGRKRRHTDLHLCQRRTQNHKKYSVQKGLYGQHGRGFLCKGM